MQLAWIAFAVVAGFLLPFQAGANQRLGRETPTMFHAALFNFVIGTLALLAISLASGKTPSASRLASAPWWAWTGGFVGALFVAMTVVVTPKTGAVLMLAAAVAGQTVGSLVVDHFGMMGLPALAITPMKVVGVVLLLAGVAAIRYA